MGVGSYIASPLEATRYRTYDWGPPDSLPKSDPRLDTHAVFNDHLTGAIDLGLAAKGLVRAEAGTTPDLLIHYHATAQRQFLELEVDPAFNTYPPQYRGDSAIREYDAATLVLDVVEARTQRLLWRGWVEDALANILDDQRRMERHVAASVKNLMEELPFGRQ
jgi:hypothetical protein